MDWKNIWERAGKTFVEAFVPALVVALSTMDWQAVVLDQAGWRLLIAALMGAMGTAISVAWNAIEGIIRDGRTDGVRVGEGFLLEDEELHTVPEDQQD